MTYRQLTQEQRYQIYACMKANWSQLEIASEISVHPSTISRELSRNQGGRGYRPKQAQQIALARKERHVHARIPPQTWRLIESCVRQDWSPEQISGWLFLERRESVSHERIYQYIYADKARGGILHQHLRCRKQRRKRYGSYQRRGRIKGRCSISERPALVLEKRRLPKEERLFKDHRERREASDGSLKQSPAQNAGLQNTESSILQTETNCTYNLNPRAFSLARRILSVKNFYGPDTENFAVGVS